MLIHVWKEETIMIRRFKLSKNDTAIIGSRKLNAEEWARLKKQVMPHIAQKTRFDLYEDEQGVLHYLPIKIPSESKNDLLDDDLQRSFEQGVRNTQELTRSKWEKLVKVGIVFLLIIFSVGAFMLFMVMLNKGQADFAQQFAGLARKGLNVTKVFGA